MACRDQCGGLYIAYVYAADTARAAGEKADVAKKTAEAKEKAAQEAERKLRDAEELPRPPGASFTEVVNRMRREAPRLNAVPAAEVFSQSPEYKALQAYNEAKSSIDFLRERAQKARAEADAAQQAANAAEKAAADARAQADAAWKKFLACLEECRKKHPKADKVLTYYLPPLWDPDAFRRTETLWDLIRKLRKLQKVGVVTPPQPGTVLKTDVNDFAGDNSGDVAFGDVNTDGIADLVAVHTDAGDLSIRLGNGDGTFGLAQSLAAGDRPVAVALADLNLDGFTDLAVANSGSIDLWVFLGDGDGSFWSTTVHELTGIPDAVVATDVDGDGLVDLATANSIRAGRSVLFATGGGLFGVATDVDDDGVAGLPVVYPVLGGTDVVIERTGGSLLSDGATPKLDRFGTVITPLAR